MVDITYPPPRKLALECDGRRAHLTERAFEEDRVRENDLKLDGWLVLRFTWRRLQEQPQAVVAEVRQALRTRG